MAQNLGQWTTARSRITEYLLNALSHGIDVLQTSILRASPQLRLTFLVITKTSKSEGFLT